MKITYWESVKCVHFFSAVYCISTDLSLAIKQIDLSLAHTPLSDRVTGIKTKMNKNVNLAQKAKSQRQGSARELHGIS